MDIYANGNTLLFDYGVDTQYLTYVDDKGNVLSYMLYVYGLSLIHICVASIPIVAKLNTPTCCSFFKQVCMSINAASLSFNDTAKS